MGVSVVAYDYGAIAAALSTTDNEDFPREKSSSQFLDGSVELLSENLYDDSVGAWLEKVRRGLKIYPPELCEDGVGGTYILKDVNGESLAIFKPEDEEAFATNNPKENQGQVYKTSIDIGDAAEKEVAAYLLDKHHFAGVPITVMVRITHRAFHSAYEKTTGHESYTKRKIGSLQIFVPHNYQSWDVGSSKFPVQDVHRIGLLDCRILNLDRHGGNILVEERKSHNGKTLKLHPIDHGYSLPHSLDEGGWFEWLQWSQAKVPFDKTTKKYIAELDIEEEVNMLRTELNFRPECLHIFRITSMLVKKAVAANLTLYELGSMMSKDLGEPSELEALYEKALTRADHKTQHDIVWMDGTFYNILSDVFDEAIRDKLMV